MSSKIKFNEEQQKVIDCKDKNIVCLAGAGAGKTACLVARLRRLVSEGVNPRRILVLTFTNAAAFEMQERYKQQSGGINVPEFCTFHAFCYKLIATDPNIRKQLGYSAVPQIITEAEYKSIITRIKKQLRITIPDKVLMKEALTDGSMYREARDFGKALNQELVRKNLITFDTMSRSISALFSGKYSGTSRYTSFYTHIFIDEFQDTDPIQWEFAKAFENSDKFVVGDALQAIYAFRGADSSIIKELSEDKNWTCIKLHHNYRSSEPICKLANDYGKSYAADSYRVNMESDVPGEEVEKKKSDANYISSISELESLLPDVKIPGKTVALLARTNSEVSEIRERLTVLGLTVSTNQIDDVNVHILKSAISEEYYILWLASLLPKEMYYEFLRISAIEQITQDDFDRYYKDVYPLRKYIPIIHKIASFRYETPLSAVASRISILLNVPPVITEAQTFEELIEYFITQFSESKSSELYVGTIHSVKGLEYDSVAIFSIGGKYFRLNDEQDKNLLYVGMTRAKSKLVMLEGDM